MSIPGSLMQAQSQGPRPAPATPAAPTTPVATPSVPNPLLGQIQLSSRDIAALRARRAELTDQLNSVSVRRDHLARQLDRTGGAERAGVEQHMAVLDQRIVQLETDVGETDRLLASAPAASLLPSTTPAPRIYVGSSGPPVVFGVLGVLVLAPLAIAAAWRIIRRPQRISAPPGWTEAAQRLERLEQAVDTIAIEIERVSEGQRFTTRLLLERGEAGRAGATPGVATANGHGVPLALGAGAVEPIELSRKQRVEVPLE